MCDIHKRYISLSVPVMEIWTVVGHISSNVIRTFQYLLCNFLLRDRLVRTMIINSSKPVVLSQIFVCAGLWFFC